MTDLLEPTPSTSYGFMLLANNDKMLFQGILSRSSLQADFPDLSFLQCSPSCVEIIWGIFSPCLGLTCRKRPTISLVYASC